MFLNEKRPISLKKKNKSPENNIRGIDLNNLFKTKNALTDAFTKNIINAFGNKIKYLNNKSKQSNSQSKTKNHNHNTTAKNFRISHKANEIKLLDSFKDLNININTHININQAVSNPQIQNYMNENNYNIRNDSFPQSSPEIISINSLFNSEDIPLKLSYLNIEYKDFDRAKSSNKPIGNIRAYAVNTYQGIIRNYNEDRVSITLNIAKPNNYNNGIWPKCSLFGIYDGHGGNTCADFLKDNLHSFIIHDKNFPQNPKNALINGFQKAEEYFISNYALNKENGNELFDKSGSCVVIALIINKVCYIANVGDSRAIISLNKGKDVRALTIDHKPNEEHESRRIKLNGGKIYQTQTPTTTKKIVDNNNKILNQILIGPYRVLPGRLSVSRAIGDAEAKLPQFGGKKNVIIPNPEISYFNIDDNIDFLILGCDGIFDQLSNEDIVNCVWLTCDLEKSKEYYFIKDINDQCACAVDMIMKCALERKSLDNITVVLICFKNFEKEINKRIDSHNKDFSYQNNCNFTEPSQNSNLEKNKFFDKGFREKYDIEELEISKNKVFLKKDTPPNSTLQIFKNNNFGNFKKGKIMKKNSFKKNSKLPLSPKMKAVLKQNFFPSYLKK